VSIMRRVLPTLGLILPLFAALALVAPATQASTTAGSTHHKSSKTHHASSASHKRKSHQKSTARG
jgi:uncharacterized membrane protein